MLVRLLVAVLMIAGPIPVGTCNCAAANSHDNSIGALASDSFEHDSRCEHQTPAIHELPTDEIGAFHEHEVRSVPSHSDRHDRNCPAVNPRPLVSSAVATSAARASIDPASSVSPWTVPSDTAHRRGTAQFEPSRFVDAIPLYILILTLRN